MTAPASRDRRRAEQIADEALPPAGPVVAPPFDPVAAARFLLRGYRAGGEQASDYQDGEELTLRRWRGGWMRWDGAHWAEVEDTQVRAGAYRSLEHAVYHEAGEPKPWRPNRRKISDLVDALSALTHLPESVHPPAWLSSPAPSADAGEYVSCANGLLHVGSRELASHTPRFFTQVSVPFAYDSDAPEPARWLEFLSQLWPHDPEQIAALQQFSGYVLSGRTDLHKILLLTGPTRSGKGTIARILEALIGRGNVAAPTLASLGTNFGLAPLIGKPLAVVSDARLGGPNTHQMVERLLSISGEDMLTVDRKYRDPWTGKLPSRFVIISNELPRFGDASGAIANRFVILQTHKSWLGSENTYLTQELLPDLPGILNWALDGLEGLTGSGALAEPKSSADARVALQDLVSPVSAFVRDCCRREGEVPVKELFAAWKLWCEDNGHRVGSSQSLGRDLRAVLPALRVFRPHGGERSYVGISLPAPRLAAHADVDPAIAFVRGSMGSPRSERFARGSGSGSREAGEPQNRVNRVEKPLWVVHEGASTEPGAANGTVPAPIRAVEICGLRPAHLQHWDSWRRRVVKDLSARPGPNPVVLSVPDGRRELLPGVLSSVSGGDKLGDGVEVTWTTIPGSPSNDLRQPRGEEVSNP
jgi:putative DNA primase/helicase